MRTDLAMGEISVILQSANPAPGLDNPAWNDLEMGDLGMG